MKFSSTLLLLVTLGWLSGFLITPALPATPFLNKGVAEYTSNDLWLNLTDQWQFRKDSDNSPAEGNLETTENGKQFVLSYDFEKGGSFVEIYCSLEPLVPIESLTMAYIMIHGPGGPVALTITDATDQVLVYPLGTLPTEDKRVLTTKFEKPESATGGAADKTIHYPVKGVSLMIQKAPPLLKGSVTIERFVLKSPQFQKTP